MVMLSKLAVVVILKCTEISNHYVCKRSIVLEVNYFSNTKLIGKEIRFVVTRGGGDSGKELDEGNQKAQTSSTCL